MIDLSSAIAEYMSRHFRRGVHSTAGLARVEAVRNSPLLLAMFDDAWYLDRYPDTVRAMERNELLTPMEHYFTTGLNDGRVATPYFDAEYYFSSYAIQDSSETRAYAYALLHYLKIGYTLCYNPVPIFDEAWYTATHSIDRRQPEDYLNGYHHFIAQGAAAGLNPSPLFDERWYRRRYPDVAYAIESGLLPSGYCEYIRRSDKNERDPCPYFDAAGYRQRYRPEGLAYFHFLTRGAPNGYDPGPYFDPAWYNGAYPDSGHASGYHHYLYRGALENKQPTPWFMPKWYLDWYPDARAAVENGTFTHAFEHYLQEGLRLQLSPNLYFDERWYRQTYKDVDAAVVRGELLSGHQHFMNWGVGENRQGSTVFDASWYLDQYAEAGEYISKDRARNAYDHFCRYGFRDGLSPCADFDERWYLRRYAHVQEGIQAGRWISGLHHFVIEGTILGYSPRLAPQMDTSGPNAAASLCARLELREFLERHPKLRLRHSVDDPVVSILLVLYNRAELTMRCLRSIASWAGLPYEVIVVDNASSDDTTRMLARVRGIRIVRNEQNRHFLLAVNQGAKVATGKYLLLLNNDSELQAGALRSAVAILENEPDVGAVGGKLILHNALLQEAGSYLLPNAFSAQFGRGQEPFRSDFMHRRDVPYSSGAFLMTPRQLFLDLGSFDEAFYPAYCEDVDYCLRLWQKGLRVVFNPDSMIVHHETGSSKYRRFLYPSVLRNFSILHSRYRDYCEALPDYGAAPVSSLDGRRRRESWLVLVEDVSASADETQAWNALMRSMLQQKRFLTVYPLRPWWGNREALVSWLPAEVELVGGKGFVELETFCKERAGIYDGAVLLAEQDSLLPEFDLSPLRRWLPGVELKARSFALKD